jgi:hypothetical protein
MRGFSVLTSVRTKIDVLINGMESQIFINISQYRAVAMYSETEVQVFLKELKQLTTVQYVIAEKE